MNLRTGDIIKTDCHLPLCYHVAVVVKDGDTYSVYNSTPMHENEYGGNIICQTLEDFLVNDKREIIDITPSSITKERVINYVEKNKTRKWDAVAYTCDTFIDDLLVKEDETQVVKLITAVSVTAFGLYILFK